MKFTLEDLLSDHVVSVVVQHLRHGHAGVGCQRSDRRPVLCLDESWQGDRQDVACQQMRCLLQNIRQLSCRHTGVASQRVVWRYETSKG